MEPYYRRIIPVQIASKRKIGLRKRTCKQDFIKLVCFSSPFSIRIAATVIFVVVVLILEGLNLIHSIVTSDDGAGSHDVTGDKYRDGAVASEVAALIHYGTTVRFYQQLQVYQQVMDKCGVMPR